MSAPAFCAACHGFDGEERRLDTTCDRCGAPACRRCDRCYGCRRIVCGACNEPGTPSFAFPGDQHLHPHNVSDAAC